MPFSIYISNNQIILLLIVAFVGGFAAQIAVKNTYRKYSAEYARSGVTAAQAAQLILQQNGVYDVTVGQVQGELTDHYSPNEKVLRLSQGVYASPSIAALGIAAHEAGHAIQHAQGYGPLLLRNTIVPVANFGSRLSMPLLLVGLFLNSYYLAIAGVLLYGLAVLFQLITLPVEINASRRAMDALCAVGLVDTQEEGKVRKVLSAAAATYAAAALAAVAQFLRLMSIAGRKR